MGYPIEFKEGVFLHSNHCIEPGISRILWALSMTAPRTVGGVVMITSTFRPDPNSYHSKYRAIDVRTGFGNFDRRGAIINDGPEDFMKKAQAWAWRIRHRLGFEFDVVFGDDSHKDHIHVEHDANRQYIHWTQENAAFNELADNRLKVKDH